MATGTKLLIAAAAVVIGLAAGAAVRYFGLFGGAPTALGAAPMPPALAQARWRAPSPHRPSRPRRRHRPTPRPRRDARHRGHRTRVARPGTRPAREAGCGPRRTRRRRGPGGRTRPRGGSARRSARAVSRTRSHAGRRRAGDGP
ncbi:MAG: hypothetical protein KIT35_02680 [Piscinibacter sp.]|uniref:hypothetical protein n=1 Tax=Piscinibacter sp. TaxID=1903157 RepID=UPI00258FF13F|nr:hypothetical protein [Piscinibacter sp.]MCW5662717.1 hypothetical protein [Piscinibacter sp.]